MWGEGGYEISKLWKRKVQHREYSQLYCNNFVRWSKYRVSVKIIVIKKSVLKRFPYLKEVGVENFSGTEGEREGE